MKFSLEPYLTNDQRWPFGYRVRDLATNEILTVCHELTWKEARKDAQAFAERYVATHEQPLPDKESIEI